MIIFIGGFVGSGREQLGLALSEKLGFAHLSVIDAYGYDALLAAHKSMHTRRAPFDDSELALLYKDLAARMPKLITMRGGIVLCVGFHRKKPREILLATARALGPVRIIWIESSDDAADARMRAMSKAKPIPGFATLASLRAVMQFSVEPLEEPIVTYQNEERGQVSVERFLDFYEKSFSRL